MAISGVTSSGGSSPVDQDLQVKSLKAKIDDWSTCPTTDPATKKSIVDRLQSQLDTVTTSLQAREKAKADDKAKANNSDQTGVGAGIDLSA